MKTELIACFKHLLVKGVEKVLITTVSGAQIWVNKDQFDSTAEVVSYTVQPVGTKYTDKATGTEKETTSVSNQLNGFNKQVAKKFNAVELFAELQKIGITPAINVG
mgnify:CR=1 FL=1|tara:strand:- start:43813 stop:44130 length:318 start_codon:yes stop_codon:yes gene_type:complete